MAIGGTAYTGIVSSLGRSLVTPTLDQLERLLDRRLARTILALVYAGLLIGLTLFAGYEGADPILYVDVLYAYDHVGVQTAP